MADTVDSAAQDVAQEQTQSEEFSKDLAKREIDSVLLQSNAVLARVRDQRPSVFEELRRKIYANRYLVTLGVETLVGGIPSDPKVAEGWIKTKLATNRDDLVRQMVAETMVERKMDAEEAIEEASRSKHLNGFKRLPDGQLAVEGRQVKAMLREAANIAWPKRRWGPSNKGTKSFIAEHLFVEEDAIPIMVYEDGVLQPCYQPSYINTRFIHTFRGSGIQLEEVVLDAEVAFHLLWDHDFKIEEIGTILVTGEENGLGAARSQSYGRFRVVGFEKTPYPKDNGPIKAQAK